jgi:peptidoglycan DL-endopeptidase CwlO
MSAVPGIEQLRAAVVARAMAQMGKPYHWDCQGPDSFDCSGLVYDALKNNDLQDAYGPEPKRSAGEWWLGGSDVGLLLRFEDRLPGDVVVFTADPGSYHVMLVENNDWLVGARGGGAPDVGENEETYTARMAEAGARVSVVSAEGYWISHRLGVIRPKALIGGSNA